MRWKILVFARRILRILSHPAWNGIAAIAAILGVFGFSILYLFFRESLEALLNWCNQPIELTRIIIALVVLIPIILFLLIRRIISILKNRRVISKPNFIKYWGVFWEIGINKIGGIGVKGPYCPEHFCEMEVWRRKLGIIFACKGPKVNEKHEIIGPSIDELIIPKDYRSIDDLDLLVKIDVVKRIEAENREKMVVNN